MHSCGESRHLFACSKFNAKNSGILSKHAIKGVYICHNNFLWAANQASGLRSYVYWHSQRARWWDRTLCNGSSTSGIWPLGSHRGDMGPVSRELLLIPICWNYKCWTDSCCKAERYYTVTQCCESQRGGIHGNKWSVIYNGEGETRKCLEVRRWCRAKGVLEQSRPTLEEISGGPCACLFLVTVTIVPSVQQFVM